MKKTKLLVIAPYEGMQTLISQITAKREDIETEVYVGDLDIGAEIAKKYSESDFDVIISRGGTAELIRQQSPLPVVEIPLTIYDILRSIKLAENYNNKYAIIGFSAITKNAHFLCDVLRYKIDIYTINNEADARKTLEKLSKTGYSMVLCDVITSSLAQHYGIRAILITSGAESVESAIEQAVQASLTYRRLKNRMVFFQTILEEQQRHIYVYSEFGELLYASNERPISPLIIEKMRNCIPLILEEKKKRIYSEASGGLYTMFAISKIIDQQSTVIYYLNARKMPLTLAKIGIHYLNKKEVFDSFFNSFFGITQSTSQSDLAVEQYAQSSQPLMIFGEIGTGKEEMVRLVYAKSKMYGNPLVTIDCSHLHEKGWVFLTDNDNSPFNDNDTTIHIKNSKILSEERFLELCTIIKDLNIHQRNRIIFTQSQNAGIEMSKRGRYIANYFSCLVLHMPPLRSHKNDIPSLASLYISILNMNMGKEIMGFENNALTVLQSYDWPNNYDQFKRVMEELVTISNSPYISFEAVTKLLKREISLMYASETPANFSLNLNRTLDEINLDILAQVMGEEKGNRNSVAKRLGISRTTLWRMLRKITSIYDKNVQE